MFQPFSLTEDFFFSYFLSFDLSKISYLGSFFLLPILSKSFSSFNDDDPQNAKSCLKRGMIILWNEKGKDGTTDSWHSRSGTTDYSNTKSGNTESNNFKSGRLGLINGQYLGSKFLERRYLGRSNPIKEIQS